MIQQSRIGREGQAGILSHGISGTQRLMFLIGELIGFSGNPCYKSTIRLGRTVPREQRNVNEG